MTISLTFIQPDGAETTVNATEGMSVMEVALANGVSGIVAECNGSAACATCHTIFDDAVLPHLPVMQEHEDDMLDFAASPRAAGSRLGCQVPVTGLLNGARITVPDAQ